MVNKRKATIADVEYFAGRMRQEDVEEVWALARLSGRDALVQSFKMSRECWVGERDGKVFCILGCVPDAEGAVLWMLFTDDVQYLPPSFFRISKQHVKAMLDTYGKLHNYTDAKNTFILKWLKWLGFTIGPARPLGIDQKLCHQFWVERSDG